MPLGSACVVAIEVQSERYPDLWIVKGKVVAVNCAYTSVSLPGEMADRSGWKLRLFYKLRASKALKYLLLFEIDS